MSCASPGALPIVSEISDDLWDLIFSALPLHTLVPLRRVCSTFKDRIRRRVLPVVAPPDGDKPFPACKANFFQFGAGVLPIDLKLREQYFIRLYGDYLHWLREWWCMWDAAHPQGQEENTAGLLQLRSLHSPMDGFYSLAPWWRAYGEAVSEPWATQPWLHEALYKITGRSIPAATSTFYQRRQRNEEDAFRIFYTTPAEAWPFEWGHDASPCTRLIVLAPLNVRSTKAVDAGMPDLQPATLADLGVAKELIQAYLPECTIRIEPLRELTVSGKQLTRPDAQHETRDGARIRQLSSRALHGARAEIDAALEEESSSRQRPFINFLVAPHLYPHGSSDLAWVYSTSLDECEDSRSGPLDPWVVSSHQIECYTDEGVDQTFELCKVVVYCVMLNAIGLHVCENLDCLMNNADSVGEQADASLLLCPTCMRKLHLMGVVADVPACHARVKQLLDTARVSSNREED